MVFHGPINPEEQHVHLVMPGEACEAVIPDEIIKLFRWLADDTIKYNVTRLDLAVDKAPFSPLEFYEALKQGDLVSLAKREKIHWEESPFEQQEVGDKVGTHTCYLGSRNAQRLLRVYDKRGYTRVELECSQERAHVISCGSGGLLVSDSTKWLEIAVGHIRQYVEIKDRDWWLEFCLGTVKADMKVSIPRVVSSEKIIKWLHKQVAAAAFVSAYLSEDGLFADELVEVGRKKLEKIRRRYGKSRYDVLLAVGCTIERQPIEHFNKQFDNSGYVPVHLISPDPEQDISGLLIDKPG